LANPTIFTTTRFSRL